MLVQVHDAPSDPNVLHFMHIGFIIRVFTSKVAKNNVLHAWLKRLAFCKISYRILTWPCQAPAGDLAKRKKHVVFDNLWCENTYDEAHMDKMQHVLVTRSRFWIVGFRNRVLLDFKSAKTALTSRNLGPGPCGVAWKLPVLPRVRILATPELF